MGKKTYYATGSFKYATRMMKAGDPVEMDAPTARLFTALDKITGAKPKAANAAEPVAEPVAEKPKAPRKRRAKKVA